MENEKTALYVKDLVDRARKAQAVINDYTQEQVDELVGADCLWHEPAGGRP